MTSKEAIRILSDQALTMNKIANFVKCYDKQLMTAERFVKLVKGLIEETDYVQADDVDF